MQTPVMKAIDAARIEKELGALWAEAARGGDADSQTGVMRACVLNLIVYAESREECDEINSLLDDVMERHPSRVLLLVADRGADTARLEAFVSARCQLSTRGLKKVCGEQVTIEAAGPVVDSASTAVAPLLVPDVPVFLWWKDIPHYEDKLFDRLSALADRVVIDSASFDHPHDDFLRLAELIREGGGRLHLSDLNWGRLTSWRSLVAGFWDAASYRPSLEKLVRVVFEYDPPDLAHDEIAPKALLAAGWLAQGLGWDVAPGGSATNKDGETVFNLLDGERRVEVSLRATGDVSGRDGMITSLTMTDEAGDEFRVRLRPHECKLETYARTGGAMSVVRTLGFEAHTEGERLSAELGILARDRVFERSVFFAERLLETLSK